MVLRRGDIEMVFQKGDTFPLEILRGETLGGVAWQSVVPKSDNRDPITPEVSDSFWDSIHQIEADFQEGIDRPDPGKAINALLQLDQTIWKALQDLESEESISQAREMLREFLVLMGAILVPSSERPRDHLTPLVDALLVLRENFRRQEQWQDADAIRDCLRHAGILLEDTEEGSMWQIQP